MIIITYCYECLFSPSRAHPPFLFLRTRTLLLFHPVVERQDDVMFKQKDLRVKLLRVESQLEHSLTV